MHVRDIMTENPACCAPTTNLAAAAEMMWNNDCGVLPVMNNDEVEGILTDRDVCIALGTRNRRAEEVSAGEIATREVETCLPEDDIHAAMATMRRAKVRRLPVVGRDGQLQGLIALNDIVLAVERTHGSVSYEEVMNTLKAVSEHRAHKATASTKSPAVAAVA